MSLQNVGFYIEKLYQINKELGGKAKQEQCTKEADEFDTLKSLVLENFHKARKKMNEKMEKYEGFGKSAETMKLDIEIKDIFNEIDKNLGSMNEVLRRQAKNTKKYSKTELDNKEKIYGNLRTQIKEIRELDKESANVSIVSNRGGETLTDLKTRLMDRNRGEVRRELNLEEKDAVEKFKEKDKEMDATLDLINDGVSQWKFKAEKIGQQIDQTSLMIEKVSKEVDGATAELLTTNKKLKKIVEKYRQPNKFCLDIALLALLIGLIGVVIKMLAG